MIGYFGGIHLKLVETSFAVLFSMSWSYILFSYSYRWSKATDCWRLPNNFIKIVYCVCSRKGSVLPVNNSVLLTLSESGKREIFSAFKTFSQIILDYEESPSKHNIITEHCRVTKIKSSLRQLDFRKKKN